MTRGLETLFYHGRLLNPFRYGIFSLLLWSHKLVRWLVPWALLACAIAIVPLAASAWWAKGGVIALLVGLALAAAGWWWPRQTHIPKVCSMAAYFASGTIAGLLAWSNALRGNRAALWNPTPRAH